MVERKNIERLAKAQEASAELAVRDVQRLRRRLDLTNPAKRGRRRGRRRARGARCLLRGGIAFSGKPKAAAASHGSCDYQIVPSFGVEAPKVEGNGPDRLYQEYEAARAELIADGKKPTPGAITAKMRRLFPLSDSDSTGSKETASKRTNTLLSGVSRVRVPEGLKHGEHELESADMLVRTGSDVQVPEILPESGAKNLDELINGAVRQFDCPLWSSGRTIEGQFKRGWKTGRQTHPLYSKVRIRRQRRAR